MAFHFADMETRLADIVGKGCAHADERIEGAGLAFVQHDVVDEFLDRHQALQIGGIGKFGVIAGGVEHLAAQRVQQQLVRLLCAQECLGVATGIGVGRFGQLAIGGPDGFVVGIALNAQNYIWIDHNGSCSDAISLSTG
jgi:hypothetical protein